MRLYNKSIFPDEILRDLLTSSARSLGRAVRTGKVVVKVTQKNYRMGCSGLASDVCKVRGSWTGSRRWASCEGAFRISMPGVRRGYDVDPLAVAQSCWEVMRHEWSHIADYQAGNRFRERKLSDGRRQRHDSRPCEIAVQDRMDEADGKGNTADRAADAILALGVFIEARQKEAK